MSVLSFVSAHEFGVGATAELLTRGFEGYAVPIAFTPERLLQMVDGDSVDLRESRVLLESGRPVAAALIARRGPISRLAAMSVLAEARARGIGRALVGRALREAAERGDQAMLLEVLEDNVAAIRTYQRSGFGVIRRLVSFSAPAVQAAESAEPLPEVPLSEVARAIDRTGIAHLPWQISAPTIARLGPSYVGRALGEARLAVLRSDAGAVRIRALGVGSGISDMEAATALLRRLRSSHPSRACEFTALWPEEHAAPFLQAGFALGALAQLQMRATFPSITPT